MRTGYQRSWQAEKPATSWGIMWSCYEEWMWRKTIRFLLGMHRYWVRIWLLASSRWPCAHNPRHYPAQKPSSYIDTSYSGWLLWRLVFSRSRSCTKAIQCCFEHTRCDVKTQGGNESCKTTLRARFPFRASYICLSVDSVRSGRYSMKQGKDSENVEKRSIPQILLHLPSCDR